MSKEQVNAVINDLLAGVEYYSPRAIEEDKKGNYEPLLNELNEMLLWCSGLEFDNTVRMATRREIVHALRWHCLYLTGEVCYEELHKWERMLQDCVVMVGDQDPRGIPSPEGK